MLCTTVAGKKNQNTFLQWSNRFSLVTFTMAESGTRHSLINCCYFHKTPKPNECGAHSCVQLSPPMLYTPLFDNSCPLFHWCTVIFTWSRWILCAIRKISYTICRRQKPSFLYLPFAHLIHVMIWLNFCPQCNIHSINGNTSITFLNNNHFNPYCKINRFFF